MIFQTAVLLSFLASAQAGCDNACSGHGSCGADGKCECFANWGLGMSHDSGDCSERTCPYEFSWVDAPGATGEHHKYTECASKGICNRETAECECFPGYEGKGCQRTSCANDCSGHGTCEFIEELGFGSVPADHSSTNEYSAGLKTFNYRDWDVSKTRACVCDAEYADVDCSKRMCPHGNDIMDHRENLVASQTYQIQRVSFKAASNGDFTNWKTGATTFALTFKAQTNETYTTKPILWTVDDEADTAGMTTQASAMKSALLALPNGVIDTMDVAASPSSEWPTTDGAGANVDWGAFDFTFNGEVNQGPQNYLMVVPHKCEDGCTPKIMGLDLDAESQTIIALDSDNRGMNSFECGRRGKCDYDSGVCECFEGYTGLACTVITALV